MDKPVHPDTFTPDFGYAARNDLRRNPPVLFVSENTPPEAIEAAKKKGAILVDDRPAAREELVLEFLKIKARAAEEKVD